MTANEALKLARDLKFGPMTKPDDPMPDTDEAIELIREARKGCGFNWLTGEAAEAVLKKSREEETCTHQR